MNLEHTQPPPPQLPPDADLLLAIHDYKRECAADARKTTSVHSLLSAMLAPRAKDQMVLLDVRSPAEYETAHIPSARSLPLFDDEQRAAVGTAFKRSGADKATRLGLELVRPRLAALARAAAAHASEAPNAPATLCVYCWRGGMRSHSVAWLLERHGVRVVTLSGGYKAFRAWATSYYGDAAMPRRFAARVRKQQASGRRGRREQHALEGAAPTPPLPPPPPPLDATAVVAAARALPGPRICVVGGRTGVGKTKVILALRELGAHAIDLEGLANHRGSAFGWVGDGGLGQPSTEHFQNVLALEWHQIAAAAGGGGGGNGNGSGGAHCPGWLFLEDEDDHIGACNLPPAVYAALRCAPLVVRIVLSEAERIQQLLNDYARGNVESPAWLEGMERSVGKLQKRLGAERVRVIHEALRGGEYEEVARLLLNYYDGLYDKHIKNAGGTGSGSGTRAGLVVDLDPGADWRFDARSLARLVLECVEKCESELCDGYGKR